MWGEPLSICAGPFETEVPLVDPDHDFAGVTYQVFRKWNVSQDDVPNMGGFVERQSEKYHSTPGDAAFVIKAYDQEKTAVLAELAQNFAFFDAYVGDPSASWDLADEISSLNTPAQPILIASLRLPARLVALLTIRISRLASGTM